MNGSDKRENGNSLMSNFLHSARWAVYCLLFFAVCLYLLLTAYRLPLEAGEREDQIVRSVLSEVEQISKKSGTLESLGKKTLGQSATLLDLGEESCPVLLKALKDPGEDWKVRYWIADLLGYVGNAKALPALLAVVKNPKENRRVRLRACDSLLEMGSAPARKLDRNSLRAGLRKVLKSVRNREVKRKIEKTLLGLRKK